jgi:hypothetical protein
MPTRIALCFFVFCSAISRAQTTWPAASQTAKPWTRWWWQGSAVNEKDLSLNMEKYKAVGLGGLEITPIYGVQGYEKQFISYLSPQWMKMLLHTLKEAKRLGLGIDLATGTGWPFGGGPLITDKEACKDIVYKTYSLKSGEKLIEKIIYIQEPMLRMVSNPDFPAVTIDQIADPVYSNKNLQALALDQVKFKKQLPLILLMAYSQNGQSVDITAKTDQQGNLNWTAPQGNWTLYALFMGWHGKMVERAAPGGEGNVIDHFSLSAINKYFSRFDNAFKGNDLSHLRAFFNDSYEVDDARGQSNWTPDLFNEFRKRRGYDLKPYLPSLFEKNPTENDTRILYDYRQTIADLLLDNFTKPWHNWAKAKGKIVRNQSHGSPANILDLYAAVDIPETEGTDLLRFKFAVSAANIMGKKLASAEATTWLNEHFQSSLGDVKKAIDNYFIGGVNHIFYHGTNYSPSNESWPGWLFYAAVHFTPANPFWRDFGTLNNYITRCQSFLQSGKPDNDILLYFPFADRNSDPGKEMLHHYDGMNGFDNTDFKSVAASMISNGYSFDIISDLQIKNTTVSNSQIQTAGGAYKTILLANSKLIPIETFEKLKEQAEKGATIIFYKNMPADIPGFEKLDERRKRFKAITDKITYTKTAVNGIRKAIIGKGSFISGDNLEDLLQYAACSKEAMVEKGIQFTRRKYDSGKYYFLVNNSDKEIRDWIVLADRPVSVVLFDPMFQKKGLTVARSAANGKTEIYLQLKPGESVIVQTSSKEITGSPFLYFKPDGNKAEIKSKWTVRFEDNGDAKIAPVTIEKLISWTDMEADLPKRFSGTAVYSTTLLWPEVSSAEAWMLDLGQVNQSAEVWLNGVSLGTVIGPSYSFVIPTSELKILNELKIFVTNGMTNRIIDLDKRGVKWRKFYNVNFPSWKKENRDEKGIFTTAGWKPETSGLIGPVTLTSLTRIK